MQKFFSNVCSANLKFFFNKSAYLKSHPLCFSFKTCVLKILRLNTVGPNKYIFTFWVKKSRYWGENVGPNPLYVHYGLKLTHHHQLAWFHKEEPSICGCNANIKFKNEIDTINSDYNLILHIYIIISEHYHTYLVLIHAFYL